MSRDTDPNRVVAAVPAELVSARLGVDIPLPAEHITERGGGYEADAHRESEDHRDQQGEGALLARPLDQRAVIVDNPTWKDTHSTVAARVGTHASRTDTDHRSLRTPEQPVRHDRHDHVMDPS